MPHRRAFSLIELLVSIAIIAVLASVLLPTLTTARLRARQIKCATNLRQLGHAWHLYATEYTGHAMPLAYSTYDIIGDGPAVYWWGTNDLTTVDHTRGFLWPYLRNERRPAGLYECPDQPWGTYEPQGQSAARTSTYGYNGYYLSPPHAPGWNVPSFTFIGDRPWQNVDTLNSPQRLFVFADTLIDLGGSRPQNNALLDPPWLHTPHGWAENASPTTAFRHLDSANILHADGHVAAREPARNVRRSTRFGITISSVSNDNAPHYVPDADDW